MISQYKKYLLFLSIFGFQILGFAQQKIIIKNENGKGIYNAKVRCSGKIIATTDSDGIAEFNTTCLQLSVFAKGYKEEDIVADRLIEVQLSKITSEEFNMETVVIETKSNREALRILDEVNSKFKENHPESLPSYAYKSYEKISVDIDQDSLSVYNAYVDRKIDSLKIADPAKLARNEKLDKDSVNVYNVAMLVQNSKLFLWEKAQQYLYSKQYGDKVQVLDNRISGLNSPIYELMGFRSNRNKIPKEILPENRNLYLYFFDEPLEIDGRENYVIRFREVSKKNQKKKRKFTGYIYVDKENYAIKKIESDTQKSSDGKVISVWKPYFGKWFLETEFLKFKIGDMNFNEKKPEENKDKKETKKVNKKFGNYVFKTSKYFDFKSPIEENPEDFKNYTVTVLRSDGATMDQYRPENLSDRDTQTYEKIDSIGKKYKFDQKLGLLSAGIRGKLRYKNIDFGLDQFGRYNLYEGLRLGVGAKLNEKFNPYISPDAYIAYGFKDKAWKYGAGIDIKTSLERTSIFRAEYYNDVISAGRYNENFWNFRMKLLNGGVDLNNDRFISYSGGGISYTTDLVNSISTKLGIYKEKEQAEFPYDFNNLGNQFESTKVALSFKYSPKAKNIMTPQGKYTYSSDFPEFFLNFEKGLKFLNGELDYYKIDAMMIQQIKYGKNVSSIRLYGGISSSDAPIWKNFSMNGLRNPNKGINVNFTTFLGFATMNAREYYNDKFIGVYLGQRLPFYFRTFGKINNSIELVYKGIIGDMAKPDLHHFSYSELNKLYSEAGAEWNNFLGTPFNLGVFYRIGPYRTSIMKENLAIQLKLALLKF